MKKHVLLLLSFFLSTYAVFGAHPPAAVIVPGSVVITATDLEFTIAADDNAVECIAPTAYTDAIIFYYEVIPTTPCSGCNFGDPANLTGSFTTNYDTNNPEDFVIQIPLENFCPGITYDITTMSYNPNTNPDGRCCTSTGNLAAECGGITGLALYDCVVAACQALNGSPNYNPSTPYVETAAFSIPGPPPDPTLNITSNIQDGDVIACGIDLDVSMTATSGCAQVEMRSGFTYEISVNGCDMVLTSGNDECVLTTSQAAITAELDCGANSVTFSATENCTGITVTETYNFTVEDSTPPVITCLLGQDTGGVVDLGCNGTVPAGAEADVTVTDDCQQGSCLEPPAITWADADPVTDANCVTTVVRTYTATEVNGCNDPEQMATCQVTFQWIDDTTPPTAMLPDGVTDPIDFGCNPELNGNVPAALPADEDAIMIMDECPAGATITGAVDDIQTTGCVSTLTRTYTFEDGCTNTNTFDRVFTWTIDTDAPMIACQENIEDYGCNPELDGDGLPVDIPADADAVILDPDNCGGGTLTSSDDLSTTDCVSTLVRTYTVEDDCQNMASCDRTYTWTIDTTPPDMTCPDPITLPEGSEVPAPDIASVTATDACPGDVIVTFVEDVTTGGCPEGDIIVTRTYQAEDACGNMNTCEQVITITQVCCLPYTISPNPAPCQWNEAHALAPNDAPDYDFYIYPDGAPFDDGNSAIDSDLGDASGTDVSGDFTNGLTEGFYTIYSVDANGCPSDGLQVEVYNELEASVAYDCDYNCANITAIGGFTQFNGSNVSLYPPNDPIGSLNYTYILSDQAGNPILDANGQPVDPIEQNTAAGEAEWCNLPCGQYNVTAIDAASPDVYNFVDGPFDGCLEDGPNPCPGGFFGPCEDPNGSTAGCIPDIVNAPPLCFDVDLTGQGYSPIGAGGSFVDDICITIFHSYLGDLTITLVSPAGTILTLLDFNNNPFTSTPTNGPAIDACFQEGATPIDNLPGNAEPITGIVGPTGGGSFSTFNGENPNGIWQLCFVDNLSSDYGYVYDWSFSIVDGCQVTLPYEVFDPIEITADNDPCAGTITATATGGYAGACFTPANGTQPFTYNLLDQAGNILDTNTTGEFTGLSENTTYTVEVNDNNQNTVPAATCTEVLPVVIETCCVPYTISPDPSPCTWNTASVLAPNTAPDYDFYIYPDGAPFDNGNSAIDSDLGDASGTDVSGTFTGLAEGFYTVYAVDDNDCVSDPLQVEVYDEIMATNQYNCDYGCANITATGGFTQFNGSNVSIYPPNDPIGSLNYTYVITDQAGNPILDANGQPVDPIEQNTAAGEAEWCDLPCGQYNVTAIDAASPDVYNFVDGPFEGCLEDGPSTCPGGFAGPCQDNTGSTAGCIPDIVNAPPLCFDVDLTGQGYSPIGVGGSFVDDICITLYHSYLGDLTITLVSPAGTTLTLLDFNSNPFADTPTSGAAIDACFQDGATPINTLPGNAETITGTVGPTGGNSFSIFNGEDPNGLWQLCFVDNLPSDYGYVFDWSFSIVDGCQVTLPYEVFDPLEVDVVADPCEETITATATGGYAGACFTPANGSQNYIYTLLDAGGNVVATNTTGNFTGIAINSDYTVEVNDNNQNVSPPSSCLTTVPISVGECCATFCSGFCTELEATATDLPMAVCNGDFNTITIEVTGIGAFEADYNIAVQQDGVTIGEGVHFPQDPTTFPADVFFENNTCDLVETEITWSAVCYDGPAGDPGFEPGDTIASGSLGMIKIFPDLNGYIPSVTAATECEELPTITPGNCGGTITTSEIPPAAPACPAGADGSLDWTVDPGFDLAMAPPCFDPGILSGSEPITACDNCQTTECGDAVVEATATPTTDCDLEDGTITVTITDANGSTYEYSIDGGNNWNPSGTTLTGLPAGFYSVTVQIQPSGEICEDISVPITVAPAPGCEGQCVVAPCMTTIEGSPTCCPGLGVAPFTVMSECTDDPDFVSELVVTDGPDGIIIDVTDDAGAAAIINGLAPGDEVCITPVTYNTADFEALIIAVNELCNDPIFGPICGGIGLPLPTNSDLADVFNLVGVFAGPVDLETVFDFLNNGEGGVIDLLDIVGLPIQIPIPPLCYIEGEEVCMSPIDECPCPTMASADPTTEDVCGDATPTLPAIGDLGLDIDDLANLTLTWTPDPAEVVAATCELVTVEYTPTISCTFNGETKTIEGPIHTLNVYPDPMDFMGTVGVDGTCGTDPSVDISAATCPPEVGALTLVTATVDGCPANGTTPVDGAYTITVSLPPITGAPACYTYEETFDLVDVACEDDCGVDGCPVTVNGDPTTEDICGDATPTLPADADLGIDDLTNATVTWSPDPAEVVASTCELVTVVYTPTITCDLDPNLSLVGPAHTLNVYPDPMDFMGTVGVDGTCETDPSVDISAATCSPEVGALTEITAAINGCPATNTAPVDGAYTIMVSLPPIAGAPACYTYEETIDLVDVACEDECDIVEGCATMASADPTSEAVCGDAMPTLPADMDLGIDDMTNATITWSPDPNEMVMSTCELVTVEYTPTITCSLDPNYSLTGPIHTLNVYPNPMDFMGSVGVDGECGTDPFVNVGGATCTPEVGLLTIITPTIDGCATGTPTPVDGEYTVTISLPSIPGAPACYTYEEIFTLTDIACTDDCGGSGGDDCPLTVDGMPTTEEVCGDAMPTLPADADLGIDNIANAIVTWSPDPAEVVASTCELVTVEYTPTITCSTDANVSITGSIHTLNVYPDPMDFMGSVGIDGTCGTDPSVDVSAATCPPEVGALTEVSPTIDGCAASGTTPVDGSYTITVSLPMITGAPACYAYEETINLVDTACEENCGGGEGCATTASADPTTETVCGDAAPTLPADTDLGIDDLSNATVTWSPDPSEVTASTCELVTVVFTPTITCTNDANVNVTGPSHTLHIYPDPNDFMGAVTVDGGCGSSPTIDVTGVTCPPEVGSLVEVNPTVNGCPADGITPVDGNYTITVSLPMITDAPACYTYEETFNLVDVACEDDCTGGEGCVVVVNGMPTTEDVCGDAMPTLPADADLGIDDITNAIVTWSPDPSEMVMSTCELVTVEYTPTITCSINADVSIEGPTHTLNVYPNPMDFMGAVAMDGACGSSPSVDAGAATCPPEVGDLVEVNATVNGCPEDGIDPVDGNYTITVSLPMITGAPACYTYEETFNLVDVACIDNCDGEDGCATAVNGTPSIEAVCGDAMPSLPADTDLGIDDISSAIVTWSPDPSEMVMSTCELVTVVYTPTITCSTDANVSIEGPTHTLNVYPNPDDFMGTVAMDGACGSSPSVDISAATCPPEVGDLVAINETVSGCPADGVTPVDGNYTITVSLPMIADAPACYTYEETFNMVDIACEDDCTGGEGCAVNVSGTPTTESICGDALPNIPADTDLGIDDLTNATVTWSPDPSEVVASTCELVTVVYTPIITCSLNPDVNIEGPTHTLNVYPNPTDFEGSVGVTGFCETPPSIDVSGAVCPPEIGDPVAVVATVDGCIDEGIAPADGEYTITLSLPSIPGAPACYRYQETITVLDAACADNCGDDGGGNNGGGGGSDDCPLSVSDKNTTEAVCGDATPSLPADADLGIDNLDNAVVTWSPDPSATVASTCELVTVTYTSTITCSTDANVSIAGPTHVLNIYPDPMDFMGSVGIDGTCGTDPSVDASAATCPPEVGALTEVVATVDGCEDKGITSVDGSYTITVSLPMIADAPACYTYEETFTLADAACTDNCDGGGNNGGGGADACPTAGNTTASSESVCGNAAPTLPTLASLGLDNADNAILTWSADPLAIVNATCELQIVVYTSVITCSTDADVSLEGPTHTLNVYPDPASYMAPTTENAACGEMPTLVEMGTCPLTISDPVIIDAVDGCTASGTPPVQGMYSWVYSDPYANDTPCAFDSGSVLAMVDGCEDCSDIGGGDCSIPEDLDGDCANNILSADPACCENWTADCMMDYLTCQTENGGGNGGGTLNTVGFYTWYDLNADGIKDEQEAGAGGITVNLLDLDGNIVNSTTTDDNGFFLFTDVPSGNYYIGFELPDGFLFTSQNMGDQEETDSDVDPETGNTDPFSVGEGEVILEFGAGIIDLCAGIPRLDTRKVCDNGVEGTFDLVFSISGGIPPYTVSGDAEGTFNPEETISVTFNEAATFEITVADANGCEKIISSSDFIDCSKLEVTLVDFSGEVVEVGNLIEWMTVTELENDFFTLYHSTDGVNFEAIGTIDGAGTTNAPQTYDFLHKELTSGVHYYYLVQTDTDGSSIQIGATISLVRGEQTAGIVSIYPVPTKDRVLIQYSVPTDGVAEVQLFDINGKLAFQQSIEAKAGSNDLAIDLKDLPIGVYMVTITKDQSLFSGRIIKE